VRRRVLRASLWVVLLSGLGLNVAAFVHARALTHFTAGPRTPPPHRLTTIQKLGVLARGARLGRARNSRTPADVGLPFERHVFAGRGGLVPAALILEAPFDRLRNTVAHRFEEMGLPAFPAADLLVFWGGVQQGFPALAHDPRVYAARVSAPVLLVYGDRDAYITPAEARGVAEALRGPLSVLTCEGVGHASCLRARPGPWKEAVGTFLDRYVPGA
jgi:pimeloyl-ACP methyl ester carboxylesterase